LEVSRAEEGRIGAAESLKEGKSEKFTGWEGRCPWKKSEIERKKPLAEEGPEGGMKTKTTAEM